MSASGDSEQEGAESFKISSSYSEGHTIYNLTIIYLWIFCLIFSGHAWLNTMESEMADEGG